MNAKPIEQIVYVPNTLFVPRCVDSDASDAPTCGWFLDSTGARVRDSEVPATSAVCTREIVAAAGSLNGRSPVVSWV